MIGLLKRARRVTAREWVDLARAQLALVRAECALRVRSRGRLLAYEGAIAAVPRSAAEERRARELAWAVTRVAEYGPMRSRCLARSVALHRLLRAEGIPGSRIRIGVRPGADQLTAHAWVTLDNWILGDDPAFVARFTEIADAQTLEFV